MRGKACHFHEKMPRTSIANGITTTHVYDGTDVVMDKTGSSVQTFVRGAGLISRELEDERAYYHLSIHGDVAALTDGTATVVADYRYDAFGFHQPSKRGGTR